MNIEYRTRKKRIADDPAIPTIARARNKGLIHHTTVTISYDAPWRKVHGLLVSAAERTSGLLRESPPFVRQQSLDDFYVAYEVNAYTDNPQGMSSIYSELHQNIHFKCATFRA